MDADRVQIAERQQARSKRSDDNRDAAANAVGQITDKRDEDHGDGVAEHRNPQVYVAVEADAIGRLHRVGGTEDRRDGGDGIHQRHAHDAHHVGPAVFDRLQPRRSRDAGLVLLGEDRGLLDVASDDVAGDDDDDAEEKRHAPAPR